MRDCGFTYGGPALICSYECTFCESCGRTMDYVCPNCGGELVARPRRLEES
ncbi:DUF1272 domain-containing protein [Nocardia tengchongensis]|uniref:DUF1272 domain-containing protein n=1 Tax=Nocardia tengchongensis TaxID=2055889 RepID=A0ABX8CZ25_9NOCA|nr:DUF1272 domain-containing protein [Nocardia tengchongensis]